MIIHKKYIEDVVKKILKEDYEMLSNESLNSFYNIYYNFLQLSYNNIVSIYDLFLKSEKESDFTFFIRNFSKTTDSENYSQIFRYNNELSQYKNLEKLKNEFDTIESIIKAFKYIEKFIDKIGNKEFVVDYNDSSKNPFTILNPLLGNLNNIIIKNLSNLKNRIAGTTGSQTIQKTNISNDNVENLKIILVFEKLAFSYISEIEILFKKFQSISIEVSEENNKDFEKYNMLQGIQEVREYIKKLNSLKYKLEKEGKGDQVNSIKSKINDFLQKNIELLQPHAKLDLKNSSKYKLEFNREEFLKVLYNPKKIMAKSYSEKKAESISITLQNIDKKNNDIKDNLKQIHQKLWIEDQGKYINHKEIHLIFTTMLKIRKIYKSRINKIVTIIEKQPIESIFSEIGRECDLILKFLAFSKLNIRSAILSVMNQDSVTIDAEAIYSQYKNNQNDKMVKGLIYWNLFKKIGWVSGETPDWLTGIQTKSPSNLEQKQEPEKKSDLMSKINDLNSKIKNKKDNPIKMS